MPFSHAVHALLLAACVLAAGPAQSRAQEAQSLPERGFEQLVDAAVTGGVPGLQVHVSRGSAAWSRAAGLASVEARRAMAPTDRIRVASIAKLMTYAVIMDLVKQGRLRLSDRPARLLAPEELAGIPHAQDITIAQLLDHQSGLHNFNGARCQDFFRDLYSDPRRGSRRWSARELIAYARKPQNRPDGLPGAGTWYSSTGYMVLELVAERVTGRPIHRLYRELLFDPLRMRTAGMEGPDLTAADIVDSYAVPPADADPARTPFGARRPVRPDGLVNLSAGLRYYNAWARAAGAVSLSAGDLARFMAAVRAGSFTIFKDQAANLARSRSSATAYYDWNGGSWGVQATILYAPGQDITVIVIENGSNTGNGSHDLALELLTLARAPSAP